MTNGGAEQPSRGNHQRPVLGVRERQISYFPTFPPPSPGSCSAPRVSRSTRISMRLFVSLTVRSLTRFFLDVDRRRSMLRFLNSCRRKTKWRSSRGLLLVSFRARWNWGLIAFRIPALVLFWLRLRKRQNSRIPLARCACRRMNTMPLPRYTGICERLGIRQA